MRLDRRELLLGQSRGLEQDPVRNPDLADVVQRRRALDHLHLRSAKPNRIGQQTTRTTDPPRVLLRSVVAKFGRERQPAEHLEARVLEIASPLSHLLLETRVVITQPTMQLLDLEQIPYSQKQLELTERLSQEVAGTAVERSLLDLFGDIGGK